MVKTTCLASIGGETAAMAHGQGGWVLGRRFAVGRKHPLEAPREALPWARTRTCNAVLRRQLRAVCRVCRGAGEAIGSGQTCRVAI